MESTSVGEAPSPHPTRLQATPGPRRLIEFDPHSEPLEFLGNLFDRYGDVVRYDTRFGPCVLLSHPHHVQAVLRSENFRRTSLVKMVLGEGLLASEGTYWRSQRHLMQADFMPRRVASFVSLMRAQTERTMAHWREAALSGSEVDVAQAMTGLTLQIVVQALFGSELSSEESGRLCSAVTVAINDLGRISWMIFGAPASFTPERNAEFLAAKRTIDGLCHEMIGRRRCLSAEQRPPDLLTLLIEACSAEGDPDGHRIRDEMVSMLIGGHETTAWALSWVWKALAEHPQVEARLHGEVDAAFADGTAEDPVIPALPWTRAILHEGLRLYPPVWLMARVSSDDATIDGHPIPRGACVLVAPWFTHRHRHFWSEPERFKPERFLPQQTYPREAYLPFGAGRHTCLGMHLALLEGTLILAWLSRRFRVTPTNASAVRAKPGITLRQAPGLRARVEPRIPAGAANLSRAC